MSAPRRPGILAAIAEIGGYVTITAVLSFGPLTTLGVAAGLDNLAPLAPVVLTTAAAAGSIFAEPRKTLAVGAFGWRLPVVLLAGTLAGDGLGYLATVHNLTVVVAAVVAASAAVPILLASVATPVIPQLRDYSSARLAVEAGTGQHRRR